MSYLLQFILAGSLVCLLTYLGQKVGPFSAGIINNLPVMTIIAMCFIYLAQGEKAVLEMTKWNIITGIAFFGFLISIFFLLQKYNFWISLSIALTLNILFLLFFFFWKVKI